jgi:RimJ/RimL family protein N-acetyltransferase
MELETERLTLRPWRESDAEDLFRYASDPDVGPPAGWNAHASVEESRDVIKNYFSGPETYAVVLKETGRPIGSVGLMIGKDSHLNLPDTEAEIGYWIGVPFWGRRLIPEAVKELTRRGFEDLNLQRIWAGYFDGNVRSKRVLEKCGFRYRYTKNNVSCFIEGDLRTEHIVCVSKDEQLVARQARELANHV